MLSNWLEHGEVEAMLCCKFGCPTAYLSRLLLIFTTVYSTPLLADAPNALPLSDRAGGGGRPDALESGSEVESPVANEADIAVSEREKIVRDVVSDRISLIPHKRNYVLPATYNADIGNRSASQGTDFSEMEVQFQLSVQVPLWRGVAGDDSFASIAYTNRSFWQAYAVNAPFRESNHEPELLVTWLSDWEFLGFNCIAAQVGFSHQSNGRGDELSRGWNRIYSRFIFEREDYFFSVKPWYRIPESAVGDDNPDIEAFLGNFELDAGYRGDFFSTSVMVRNNLRSDNRGAVEMRFAFPLGRNIRGYVRYFNGYGDGLINYDRSTESIGIGVELARGL